MRRKWPVALTLAVIAFGAATVAALWAQKQPEPQTFMVPMRDGVKLATEVWLPEGDGPWPVLLVRTPYGRSSFGNPQALRMGYAVVAQDCRGRFDSEGENMAFIDDAWGERQDGYDTVEWIAEQAWCNGKVGTMGGSAMGITQNLMAPSAPPHLACQFVVVAPGDMYRDAVFQGGVFRKALVETWLQTNHFDPKALQQMLSHPDYDEFWRGLSPETHAAQIKVPVYQTGGWFDIFSQGTVNMFIALQQHGGPGAKGNAKLVMGPWTHGGAGKRQQGEMVFPEQAQQSPRRDDLVEWFGQWLKGEDNGIMGEPAVTYYVMGDVDDPAAPGNEWRQVADFPPEATPVQFYLHSGGGLSREKPKADDPADSYEYDPANPVPTRGGNNLTIPAGSFDQRPVEKRPDVLLYTTAPLSEPLEATGWIGVRLYAASSCKDTDFTAKLTDVYPDGRSMLIADGIIRARHRESMETGKLMEPGNVCRFEVNLWPTSIVFNKGHRIRVAISSSNAPRFDPNPNTGEPFRASDRTVVARNSIYHDAAHPSALILPVPE
jgi:predicted acyl esterase